MSYQKLDQLHKNIRESKVCKKCDRDRLIKFFEKPTSLVCNECKLKAKRVKKQNSLSKTKDLAWKSFATYIRTRDSLKTTGTTEQCVCITCGKIVDYKSIQAGHFVGGRGSAVLFDEELVNGQCMRCNIMLKGNYDSYNLVMLEKYGGKKVVEMLKRKQHVVQYRQEDYIKIIKKYDAMLADLKQS